LIFLFLPLALSAYTFDAAREKLILRYGEKAVVGAIDEQIFPFKEKYEGKGLTKVCIEIEKRFPELLVEHYRLVFDLLIEDSFEIKDRLLDLYRRSSNIKEPKSLAHVLFHLVRLASFFEEIPSLKKTPYFQKQLDLLTIALKYLKKVEQTSLSNYTPIVGDKKKVISFDDKGVFKISAPRDREKEPIDLLRNLNF